MLRGLGFFNLCFYSYVDIAPVTEADKLWKAVCTEQINIQELIAVYTIPETFRDSSHFMFSWTKAVQDEHESSLLFSTALN